jgi:hypothetical protein
MPGCRLSTDLPARMLLEQKAEATADDVVIISD